MDQDIQARFLAYRDSILRKEEKILASLQQPLSIEELGALRLFYGPQNQFDSYIQFWERQGLHAPAKIDKTRPGNGRGEFVLSYIISPKIYQKSPRLYQSM